MIDGKAVAQGARERVRNEVAELTGELGRPPGLATVLVGDDPASAIYVRRKREACEEAGISSIHHEPDASIPETELLELVAELNDSEEVDGILVQLPLPEAIDARRGRRLDLPGEGRRRADARRAPGSSPAASPGWCLARRAG